MYANCNLLTSNADFQESADAWLLASYLFYLEGMDDYMDNVVSAWCAVGVIPQLNGH